MHFFKFISIITIFCCQTLLLYAQDNSSKVDSLFHEFQKSNKETRLKTLSELTQAVMEIDIDSGLVFANLLLKESNKEDKLTFRGDALNMIAFAKRDKELFVESLVLFEEALTIRLELNQNDKASVTLNLMGTAYHKKGDLEKALEYYLSSLRYAEINNASRYLCNPISNLGKLYTDLGEYEKAKAYDSEGLSLSREVGDKLGMAQSYNSLGTIFQETGHLDTAKLFYKEALKLYTESNHLDGAAHVYNNMAIIYFMEGKYDQSLSDFRASMKMRLEDNDMVNYSQSLMNLGIYYQMLENYDSAIYYAGRSVDVAKQHGALIEQKDAYLVLAESYESINEYEKSLRSFQNFILIKDSIMDEKRLQNMQELETKYQTEQQKKELELKDLKIQKEAEEKLYSESRKRLQFTLIGIGVFGMLLVLILIGRGYIIKRKSNLILENQNAIIEEKNKDITDSILYAQKIQEAMLLSNTDVYSVFPDSFISYMPKDIVAGDFYWWMKQRDKYFLAAADCTGHGVPGAMVSVVCANVLNKTVKEFGLSNPAEILDKATDLVIEAFSTGNSNLAEIKDGMDIALCSLEFLNDKKEQVKLDFSGANNSLWIFRENGEFEELKSNRQPIGYYEYRKKFKCSSVILEKGDTIYLFSDGYIDQFGGDKNKKYKSSKFKKTLMAIQNKSLNEQKIILEMEIKNWMGEIEQTDDICIIGVRV